MLEFDFEESVGYWICTTSHALRKALESKLLEVGITLRQWEVLACLACEEGLTQAEMADRLGIEPPTLAGVVGRMERDGWLERVACQEDRRKNRVYPTPQAENVWKQTTEICHGIRQQATAGLDASMLECLKVGCEQIRANLEAAGHSGSKAPCLDTRTSADPGNCQNRRSADPIVVGSQANPR